MNDSIAVGCDAGGVTLKKFLHVLVNEGVIGEPVTKIGKLAAVGKRSIEQQVTDFREAGAPGIPRIGLSAGPSNRFTRRYASGKPLEPVARKVDYWVSDMRL
jgi:hypothetical protein